MSSKPSKSDASQSLLKHDGDDDMLSDLSEEKQLEYVARRMREGLVIENRRYHLKTYEKCFIGSEAFEFLIADGIVKTEADAKSLGDLMIQKNIFHHCVNDHSFKNEFLYYRFYCDEAFHGSRGRNDSGQPISWADFSNQLLTGVAEALDDSSSSSKSSSSLLPSLTSHNTGNSVPTTTHLDVSPLDEFNSSLLDQVHPASWINPVVSNMYNLLVIGAGAGGLVSSAGSIGLGAKVALVEENLMGGDCLNVGCVPSKAIIAASLHAVDGSWEDKCRYFEASMRKLRKVRSRIAENDSAERFARLGVDVFFGRCRFTGPATAEVVSGNNEVTHIAFRKCIIASGGRARVPEIANFNYSWPYLTNMNIFNLTTLPARLVVIGGGPIGMELSQAFARFGTRVTIVTNAEKILPREDDDASALLSHVMTRTHGISIFLSAGLERVEYCDHVWKLRVKHDDVEDDIECDQLLFATGRKPNVENMNLELAGVEYDVTRGVAINDYLQTTNKNIFAVGDCCNAFMFTHVSDFMARIAIRNSLFFGHGKLSQLVIPWCTFTRPEIAHVGLYPRDMEAKGILYQTFSRPFSLVDRSVIEAEFDDDDDGVVGFVKIHVKQGTDEILGASIVHDHAGDMISEITLAITNKIGLGSLANTIHPYPTHAEAIRQCGDMYNKTRLTLVVKSLLRNVVKLQL